MKVRIFAGLFYQKCIFCFGVLKGQLTFIRVLLVPLVVM